jgi:hypothetical protein
MVEDSIRIANLEYKSHYFFHQNNQQINFNVKSFDDFFHNIKTIIYKPDNCNNLQKYIQLKTIGCRHLLHDDSWMKITTKNNKLNKIEELEELINMEDDSIAFVNSINSDDISNILFLEFVDKINNSSFNEYSLEFKYIDFDEDNEDVKWIIICCTTNKKDKKDDK